MILTPRLAKRGRFAKVSNLPAAKRLAKESGELATILDIFDRINRMFRMK